MHKSHHNSLQQFTLPQTQIHNVVTAVC